MASGGETVDEEMLLGSPSVVERTDAGSSSSSSDNNVTTVTVAGGEAAAPTGQKRKPKGGPPLALKKKPKRAKHGSSFEQAEKDNLLGVILDRDDPYKILSRELITELRRLLIERLEGTLDNLSLIHI